MVALKNCLYCHLQNVTGVGKLSILKSEHLQNAWVAPPVPFWLRILERHRKEGKRRRFEDLADTGVTQPPMGQWAWC